VTTLADWS